MSTDVLVAAGASGPVAAFNEAGILLAGDVQIARRILAVVARAGNAAAPAGVAAAAGPGDTARGPDGDTAAGPDAEAVTLAVALAVWATRLGHVCVDLAAARTVVEANAEVPADALEALGWPDPHAWLAAVAAHPAVAGGDDPRVAPLRLDGSRLYLHRYWVDERFVAERLSLRAAVTAASDPATLTAVRTHLDRLFGPATAAADGSAGPPEPGAGEATGPPPDRDVDRQRLAAASAALGRLTVVAGGPGTGKTVTVARILALLDGVAVATGRPWPTVALAAPTGKAAARLTEAVHEQADRMLAEGRIDAVTAERLRTCQASTLHRLLGWRPGGGDRFLHGRSNPLPHDVVVVDETSMVSVTGMARLLEAVRDDAGLVLVGDPDQLASVEAGDVLGAVVGRTGATLYRHAATCATLEAATGERVVAATPRRGDRVAERIVVLQRRHRFGEAIGSLADAILRGDDVTTLELLASGGDGAGGAATPGAPGASPPLRWFPFDPAAAAGPVHGGAGPASPTGPDPQTLAGPGVPGSDAQEAQALAGLAAVRAEVVDAGRAVHDAALAGDADAALEALAALRVLCAHRRGPAGVAAWTPRLVAWLRHAVPGYGGGGPALERWGDDAPRRWYVGQPLVVTSNDYSLGLFNGDSGVVVRAPDGRLVAVFGDVRVSPSRLGDVEPMHALTVHRAQGSQFGHAVVVLPPPESPLLTRELLYTAVTRARERVTVLGTEGAVARAVGRPAARVSGLRSLLWQG